MLQVSKRFRTLLASLALILGSSLMVAVAYAPKVAAAPSGTCQYNFTASQRDSSSTATKACTEYAAKFKQASTNAVAAKQCYNYSVNAGANNKTTTTLDNRSCGSDAVGTCSDQFTSKAGDNSSTKKACSTMSSKFESAATNAAVSGKCYVLSEKVAANSNTNLITIKLADCGSAGDQAVGGTGFEGDQPADPALSGEVDAAFAACSEKTTQEGGCGIIDKYLNPAVNVLSAAVGVVVIIMFIVGGIQYASAGGEAGKVAAAKSRITNAILALVVFIFLYAVLQWLVPGGLF